MPRLHGIMMGELHEHDAVKQDRDFFQKILIVGQGLKPPSPHQVVHAYLYIYIYIYGWWFGTFFIFPGIGNHHPNY